MKTFSYHILLVSALCVSVITSCKKDSAFDDDFEPNDSKTSSTNIELGTAFTAGISEDDHDWYKFVIDNDDIIDITEIALTDVSADLDLACTLYYTGGTYTVNADPGMEFAINLATTGGTFYLDIYSYSGNNQGYYTLTITDTDSNDDYEPDESFGTAKVVNSYPTTLTGNIIFEASSESDGDWEFFKVYVPEYTEVSFQVAPDEEDMVLQYEIFGSDQVSIQDPVVGTEGQALSYDFGNSSSSETYFFIKLGGTPSDRLNGNYTISFTSQSMLN